MTLSKLASLIDPVAYEKYRQQKESEESQERRHRKQIERLTRVAMTLDHSALAELFAHRTQLLFIFKNMLSIKNETFGLVLQSDRRNAIRAEGYAEISQHLAKLVEKNKSDRKKGALKRHANDEKQGAKVEVRKFWDEWKQGRHKRIRTVEQFATETLRKWPVLTSANVIRRWSAQWTKETRPAQPC